jgi:sentrin-specific protease 1
MLQERDKKLITKYSDRKPSLFMNSFFMVRLLATLNKYDYDSIKNWTKNVDIFTQDKVFFPVNHGNSHWTLAVVYIQKKEIHVYDSIVSKEAKIVAGKIATALLKWVADEGLKKKTIKITKKEWNKKFDSQIPQQENGYDCGVFCIICADFLSDNLPLKYSQHDMSNLRNKIAADILRGELNYPIVPKPM